MKPRISDFILAAFVIAVAIGIWIFPSLDTSSDVADISQGDEKITVSLRRDAEYSLEGCVVAVEDGGIYIKETNCPDRVCEKTGKISKAGEAIICVPNKVSITIAGASEFDAMAG